MKKMNNMSEDKEQEDCPTQLVKLAESPFEKAVVVEFIEVESKVKEEFIKLKVEMKNIRWLLTGVLAVIVVNILVRVI
jgi:hypothetical protein